MKSYFVLMLFIAVISSILSGCSEESLAIDESVNVEWSELARTGVVDENIRKQFLVFDHPQGLDKMFLELSIPQQAIDFSKYQVVMLGIGEHGEGDSLSIRSAEEFKRHTQVNIDFNRPGDHCIVFLFSISPIVTFYKIKTTEEILISEHLNLAHCEPQPSTLSQ